MSFPYSPFPAKSGEYKSEYKIIPPTVFFSDPEAPKESIFRSRVRTLKEGDSFLCIGILPESMEEENNFTLTNDLNQTLWTENFMGDGGMRRE
jgi:hypothetical protein